MRKQKIRKIFAAGLCVATCALCLPAQPVYAEPVGVVAEDPDDVRPPEPLVPVAQTVGCDFVTIAWGSVDRAVSYELQQSEDKKNYETVATLMQGEDLCVTAQGLYTAKTYYYRVVMTDEAGETTTSSRLKVKTVLPAPAVTKLAASGSEQIDIAWTAVEGAAFYRVYRSLTRTGGYKSVKTVYGTSYTNHVATGTTYYYKIMPLRYNPDGKKVRGRCSAPKSVKAVIGAPVISSVTNAQNNTLTVTWSGVPDAEGYAVYRSLERKKGYKAVATLDSSSTGWTDTTVTAGTKYYYKVSAGKTVNGEISYGTRSVAMSKWTKSDAPADLTVSQDGDGGVSLQWSPSKAASSYRVYRAQGTGADYQEIATRITACNYKDTGLSAGETYSYRIVAVHGTLVSEMGPETSIKIGAIKVSTRTLFLGPGVTASLTATTDLPGTLTWSSEDPSIAMVGADGTVAGIAPGKTNVKAEVGGVVTNVVVTVTDCQINGIDVSKWQQAIDWAKVKNSGIRFALLRLTHGTSVDIQFENNYAGATEQGLDVGVYCYTCAKSVKEGIKEAEKLVELLDGRELTYPVALDLEDELQIKNMNKEMRTELILEYKRIIEEAGYDFVVYANRYWLTNYIDQTQLEEENVDIWIARYRDQSLGHGYTGGGNVRIWQYSSTGQVDGILDAYGRYINVDLDVCYEDY